MFPKPIQPQPGQESVWDYPRPPRLEQTAKRLRVVFAGQTIAETTRGWRVLETSHPPVYYFPPADIVPDTVVPSQRTSYCEWKGAARYYTVRVGQHVAPDAAWGYPQPTAPFAPLAGHIAFYARAMDACFVDDEQVVPQPGDFYGGWITKDIVGPFKGVPGSWGW
ncbi:DUF427 domain-containing protein [Chloracidobacterium validum]|uniref:DUF427 domain-containing protein n=1 Tax=Chloracidobacterium validum TaxID=2821543 RepID=A0ABX8BF58_9BACT|nr:DUF427 domain-containing protein [Chloracidobacterium validum]QUW04258.1 DUF427 domain-containing protein [Chloracidobacterium validum]